jgi:3-oxoacyl-[acyl-carrier protein] reductase
MIRRSAIVTGASKGLGAATAKALAARGHDVVVNYNSDAAGAEAVCKTITEQHGTRALAVQADVTDAASVDGMIEQALSAFRRIDILVNNANIRHYQKAFVDLSLEEFEHKVHGEMRAAFLLTQAVLPTMTRQGWGRLVYISTEHADGPISPGMISSGTAKAALNTFMKYIAHEVGKRNITANTVQCGMMNTPATAHVPGPIRERIIGQTPLSFIAEPEDVADAVCFFAGDDSRYVTGATLQANGGLGISRLCPPNPAPTT